MRNNLCFMFATIVSLSVFAQQDAYVHHPEPKEPVYLNAAWYAELKKSIDAPPAAGSEAQKKDEAELFRIQKARTPQDCERAISEIHVNIENFFTPRGKLTAESLKKMEPYFQQIRNDADYFIQKLKKDYARPRPFVYLKGLEPCLKKEVTDAYPSGHATLAKLFALILSDLHPDLAKDLDKRAKEIGDHRVLGGVHHPSDIQVGFKLAEKIYSELKKSKKYQDDLKKFR